MYKYIVIGHGEFPKGVVNSFEMLSGEINKMDQIQFDSNMDFEEFREGVKIKLDTHDKWIIFTDIMGGSPMQTALGYIITEKNKNSIVIPGFNISLLLDVYFKIGNQDIESKKAVKIINESIQQTKEMMGVYDYELLERE